MNDGVVAAADVAERYGQQAAVVDAAAKPRAVAVDATAGDDRRAGVVDAATPGRRVGAYDAPAGHGKDAAKVVDAAAES